AHMDNCNPSQTAIDTESKLKNDDDPVSDLTLYRSLAGSLQYLTFTRPNISYAVQQLFSSSTTDLVAYSDADWAGCPTTRNSTLEAKYRGVADVIAETCWLLNLLRELHTPLSLATLVYCDNVSAVYLSSNQFVDIFTKGLPSALFEEFHTSLSVWCPPALTSREAHMDNCNPSQTAIDTESKLKNDDDPVSDLTLYRSLAGSLQYLTFTRPNISYAVQQLFSSSTTDLVAYSDADWAGCPTTRSSTLEAKYRGVADVIAETCWLLNLLRELHTPLSLATLVYCDNVSAVYLSSNQVQHQRTKHIEIDIHFV
nr:ribonuclease H-like domain-containing protein [Tanacetum cinerariifolium]